MAVEAERLPVERFEFSTSDLALAEAATDEMYGSCRTTGEAEEGFTFEAHRTMAGGVSLDHLVHSMNACAECDPLDHLIFVFLTGGSLTVTTRHLETRLRGGDTAVYPVGMPLEVRWERLRTEVLSMPLSAAEQAAAEQGHRELQFVGMTPVSPAMDRLWRSTVGFVANQLETPDSPLSEPLAHAESLSLLGAAAVRSFPNTTMTADYQAGPGQVAPAALRRAIAFIEANADRPLVQADIADAVSVSPRALQEAFLRHYGTGPLGYLRRVRLERAHLDLQSADPTEGGTVAGIAARWGFLKPGNFVAAYREVYGQSPSHTLRT